MFYIYFLFYNRLISILLLLLNFDHGNLREMFQIFFLYNKILEKNKNNNNNTRGLYNRTLLLPPPVEYDETYRAP